MFMKIFLEILHWLMSPAIKTKLYKKKEDWKKNFNGYGWRYLRQENLLFDGTLKSVDGEEIRIHKALFAAKSSFFRAAFSGRWKSDAVMNLNCTSPILKLLVNCMYQHFPAHPCSHTLDLLVAANMYSLPDVIEYCADRLLNQLSPTNCIQIHLVAATYLPDSDLQQSVFKFILKNFQDIVEVNEFLWDISARDLERYLTHDFLNVWSEVVIDQVITRWISIEPEERRTEEETLRRAFRKVEYDVYLKPVDVWPRIPHQVITVVGGYNGGGICGNHCEAYDPRSGMWLSCGSLASPARAYHGMAEVDGLLYLVGGFDGMYFLSSVQVFDPVNWTCETISPMLRVRCYVAVVAFDGSIYAFGGYNGEDRHKSCERYDVARKQWYPLPSMAFKRSDASAAVLNSLIYVAGGYDGDYIRSTVEIFDPVNEIWQLSTHMPGPRSGLQVISHNNRLFILGGFDGTDRLNSVYSRAEEESEWRQEPSMTWARTNFSVVFFEGHMWAIGGYNTDLGTMEYTEILKEGSWQPGPQINVSRSCCTAVVLNCDNEDHHFSLKNCIESQFEDAVLMYEQHPDVDDHDFWDSY